MSKPQDLSGITAQDVEIQKTLCLSTAHVSPEDIRLIEESVAESESRGTPCPGVLVVQNDDYCCTIYINFDLYVGETESETEDEYRQNVLDGGFSSEFFDLMRLASRLECDYLKLDADGDMVDDLRTFDW